MPGVKPRYGGAACAAIATGARSARSASRGDVMGLNIRPSNENGPGKPPGPVSCDQRRSDLADVLRLQALGTLSDLELHRIALGEAAEALRLDRCEVDEHVRTRLLRDKAKALRVVKPLHLTLSHTVKTSAQWGTAPDWNDPRHRGRGTGSNKNPRDMWSSRKRRQPVTVPRMLEPRAKLLIPPYAVNRDCLLVLISAC